VPGIPHIPRKNAGSLLFGSPHDGTFPLARRKLGVSYGFIVQRWLTSVTFHEYARNQREPDMAIPLNEVTVAEIQLRGIITGGGAGEIRTSFVFHFRRLATAIDPTKTAINTAFQANISASIAAALNVDWSATTNTVRYIQDALDAPTEFANADDGAITGDRLQSYASAYLLMRSAVRGRFYRGSKHLGPFSESDVTHATGCDIFNAGAVTRLQTICTDILAGFTDATLNVWVPCILSRAKSQLTENPTTVVTNDVVQILPNQRLGTEIRRKAPSLY